MKTFVLPIHALAAIYLLALGGCASSSARYLKTISVDIPSSLYGKRVEKITKGQLISSEGPYPDDTPPARTIFFQDPRPYGIFASGQPVYAFAARNMVRFYDLKDVAESRTISDHVLRLKQALRDRRDARALEQPYTSLPDFPPRNAGHLVQDKVHYVDFSWGSGVFYLCAFTQGPGNFPNNDELFYLFQGISHDGRLYVSADFRVVSKLLKSVTSPAEEIDDASIATARRLNREPDDAFAPDLATIRSWMASIKIPAAP